MSLSDQMAGVKRTYHRMMEHATECGIGMDGVAYQDFTHAGFYTPPPPPPTAVLFSNPNPFSSPNGEYEGYIPTSESMYQFAVSRSHSEPFINNHGNTNNNNNTSDSFISHSSASSSCGASLAGPATPPPAYNGPMTMKYPAVPITPSHVVPRQKAKRTATACEECRKRKQKCDGETPCQSCKEQKLDCKYREVSPTKKDNSLEKLISLVENCQKSMEALNSRLDTMGSTLRQIEKRLSRCYQCGSGVELETGDCHQCNNTNNIPCRL
ncbi:uncharacterized protein MYCFIDRAFT_214689 [Pseudocercospora fijiensis CIRAD86]|uniref:Zn(2)-C6 fungal-type domain-containing protein n=1 Tax=Pseudocercospora fijiensis (strain CIRAD86) TaxID=383855 RepID=M3AIA0_PSEFD|nr:uncharacterized protein MYCFIDRAFT_214689 [Pseudocercospora fijiensis CIRAD86]EME84306.1 hypothetical protein MYCFIDRAFT_214689 [Pseudocercospora fijiensis CIRAD86]